MQYDTETQGLEEEWRWDRNGRVTWILFLSILLSSCTTTRWSVENPRHLDRQPEDEKIEELYTVKLEHDVSRESPYLTFQLYRLDRFAVAERVQVERRLQQYQPTWGFAALASVGAAISFYAGSRSGLTGLTSKQQSFAFNVMGGLLSLATVAHLAPEGESIPTDETRSLRGRSGRAVVTDTVEVSGMDSGSYPVDIQLQYDGERLYDDRVEAGREGRWVIELSDLFQTLFVRGDEPGVLTLDMVQESDTLHLPIPLEDFLQPVVQIGSETADLYRSTDGSEALTTVARGSEFPLVGDLEENRFTVQFGGSLVYVDRDQASIHWRRADTVNEPSVIPAGEVPFGEVGVEFGLPEINSPPRDDAAILMSNHQNNLYGVRRYTNRDLEMMSLYFEDSFGVDADSIHELNLMESSTASLEPDVSGDRVYVWISGFARLVPDESGGQIVMVSMEESGQETVHPLEDLLVEAARRSGNSMVAFLDLTYLDPEELTSDGNVNNLLDGLYESIQEVQPESVVLFASRPGQSSGRYESLRFENRYHHIFPYYVAQAWKQGITQIDRLVDYTQNQVDYTSRRLHDRPQNVTAVGRLQIDLRQE
ncbi:MAG: hypothetical protein ACQER4_04140 [Bacteroidota bacterium]